MVTVDSKLSAVSGQRSAVSGQRSAVSGQLQIKLKVWGKPPLRVAHRLSANALRARYLRCLCATDGAI
ncbi:MULTISPECIES: hypothetical protein [Moorena]|uniref:hypothetical protein n=1 Tax=Moorena TaxID=1155738 RepID=UPI001054F296|nr:MULTISPECIES: hypothetical protein [Moorena]NEQ12828.1 hypothetical protein [Moorena sp. SIO3E2]NEP33168.1 hypothetical protein [Moorena sp. SIO3B2]NEP67408.1 hypothetical protein [Moorena sp. SIO3A5]NEQ10003.1 hypothetical protein [Moorena sp. SIO4E2]NET66995.1 hypothetical protein [Moorena sp. SIO1G6]